MEKAVARSEARTGTVIVEPDRPSVCATRFDADRGNRVAKEPPAFSADALFDRQLLWIDLHCRAESDLRSIAAALSLSDATLIGALGGRELGAV